MPEVCRDMCETVPSGPDGTSAVMNPEPLQLCAQDPASQHSSVGREGADIEREGAVELMVC